MAKRVFIDPLEFEQYVQYVTRRQGELAIHNAITHLTKYGEESMAGKEDNNPYIPSDVKIKAFSSMMATLTSGLEKKNPDLLAFEKKCMDKWVGLQGGNPSAAQVCEGLDKYYENVQYDCDYSLPNERVLSDFYYLLDLIEFNPPRNPWNWMKPDHKSNSGLTTWGDRRKDVARRKAIMQAHLFHDFDPAVAGSRAQRNKVRNIFMDSYANYYREWPYYAYIQQVLKNSNCVAWRGDEYVENYISNFIDKCNGSVTFFESDYETMDTWVTRGHANLVHQIFRDLDPKYPFTVAEVEEFHEKLFSMPVLGPQVLYYGAHTLFSGIFPTNPLESPLNLIIQLDFIQFLREKYLLSLTLDKDFILVVLGDDVIILFRGNSLPDLCEDFAIFVWDKYKIKANPAKQRQSTTSGFFCKRQFSINGKRVERSINGRTKQVRVSVYPIILVLNSIFYPEENVNKYSKKDRFIQLCQRCDNAQHHPLFKALLAMVYQLHPEFHNFELSEGDLKKYNENHYDWRKRLSGQEYAIFDSPTYMYFLSK